jgi:hypothetical protein
MQLIDANLLKDCCAVMLTRRSWGNKRKASLATVTTSADKRLLKLTKELIDPETPELVAVKRHLAETREWVIGRTMPFLGFKGGIYLAKTQAVPIIEAELPKRQARLAELVGELCNRVPDQDGKMDSPYDRKVREARDKLQELFDVRDYPTGAELARVFSIEWNWVAFTVPEGLPPELRQAEAKKLQQRFEEAGEEILIALRSGFKKLVDHAVERLTVQPGEKKKVFKDTFIPNIAEFIETFSVRNLTNDAELGVLVEQARNIIAGVDNQALRDDEGLREKVNRQFEQVRAQLDTMIAERPGRSFSFDE